MAAGGGGEGGGGGGGDDGCVEGVVDEAEAAVAGQGVGRAAQAADAVGGELDAQPVQLAVVLGDRPAEARGDLTVGRQVEHGRRITQLCLGESDEQQALLGRHRQRRRRRGDLRRPLDGQVVVLVVVGLADVVGLGAYDVD